MRLPHVTDLEGADFAVLGIPFDTGTSFRTGARFGPEAVRSGSSLLRPYHPIHRIGIFERLSGVDAGDVPVKPGDAVETLLVAQETLEEVIAAGVFPLVIGGDHTVTLAELRALAGRFGPLSLVHIDAHGDVWDSYFGQQYFHGTTFRRAVEESLIDPHTSVQAGMRGPLYGQGDMTAAEEFGFRVLAIEELRELGAAGYGELVRETVEGRPAFVSFDVDVCDPAFAPGTGTPEVGGLSSTEAQAFLRSLTGLNLVGCDVVEVSPPYDSSGAPTALLAANVAWEILCLLAMNPSWRSLPKLDGATTSRKDPGLAAAQSSDTLTSVSSVKTAPSEETR
jgi:agmatinase